MSELLASGLRSRARADRAGVAAAAAALVVPVGCFAIVAGLAAANGGYFPTSWGWSALVLAVVAAVALILRTDVAADATTVGWFGAWAALAGWYALSILWSASRPQSVLEVERILVYVAAAAAVAALARPELVGRLLAGVLAGITGIACYSLATRLVPDRLGVFDPAAGYRLDAPMGYWNGLGIFCGIGTLLALGFAARSRRAAARAVSGAAIVVLLATLYFTYSRGSWIALGAGLLAMLALSPRRLALATTLLVTGPFGAAAVWLSSRSYALTHQGTALGQAAHDGHRVALAVVLLGLAAAAGAVARGLAARRIDVPRALRLAYGGVLVLGAAVVLAVAVAHVGGPVSLAKRGWHAFSAPPVQTQGNLNKRLFNFSGNGRVALWRVAGSDIRAHPWLGSGGGSYEWWYDAHRQTPLNVRDAHDLYLETLAELGPVGLALLALAFGIPLVAAVRARRHPLVAGAFGAYVAFLVHAIVDWDWELGAVTLAAVLCAGALVVAARRADAPARGTRGFRVGALAVTLAAGAFAFVGLGGNVHLASSASAADKAHWQASEQRARAALRWAPWSSEAWQRVGEAQLALGDQQAAAASLRRAIAKDPRNWRLWTELATLTRSRAALRRATALNPLSADVRGARQTIEGGAP